MSLGLPPLLPWQPCLLAAVAGILARQYPLPAATGLALLALFPRPAPGRPGLAALVLAFLTGLGAAALALPAPPAAVPAWVDDGKARLLTGRVVSVRANPENRLACVLADVRPDGPQADQRALPGRLGLTIDNPAFRPLPGDVLAVKTKLRPTRGFSNPGTTDFARLRRLEGIFFRAYVKGSTNLVRLTPSQNEPARLREALRRRVGAVLAPPEGAPPPVRAGRAMVMALLFGDRSACTKANLDLLRRAALAHTLALSGLHVSYVVAVGFALAWLIGRVRPRLFLRLPRPYLALLLTAPLIAVYCWLGGLSPSLVRSALMFGCCGLLFMLGRRAPVLDGLFLALAVMLAADPLAAYDLRLQLSALAVAGIALFCQAGLHRLPRVALPRVVRRPILGAVGILWVSLCAEAAILPVVARTFGEVSFAPWINLAWLPVLGFAVMPLALLGLGCLAVPGLGAIGAPALLGAAGLCQGLMQGLGWLDGRGWLLALTVLRPAWPEMLGCGGLLAGLALVAAGRPRPTVALLASLGLLLGPGLWRGFAGLHERVELTVLDVGQGQAVVLDLPGDRRLLIDGGGLPGSFDVGRAVVAPALTDGRAPRLDLVLASHPHADHVKGLIFLLQRFRVGAYRDNGGTPEGALGLSLSRALTVSAIPRAALGAGDRLDLGHGLVLEILHPGPGDDREGNNGSLVARLTWNGRGLVVVPGDAEREVLRRLADSGTTLDAEVLVLPHHGSVSSLSSRFYAAVSPKAAIASCGTTWHYPADKVVARLARLGCPTYDTHHHGAVTVRFDGPDAPAVIQPTVQNATPAAPEKTGRSH